MAVGTNAEFWAGQELPAILKHGILKVYLPKFVAKLSSTNRKVVLIDGYAGEGRYESGQPGSAIQMLEIAASLVKIRESEVDVYLVERDKETFNKLSTEVEAFQNIERLNVYLYQGDINDHLNELLTKTDGMPLFLFLDPCGLGLNLNVLTGALNALRPRPTTTEILLNFSAEAVRRIGGQVPNPEKFSTTLERMDSFVGDDSWRVYYSGKIDKDAAEHAVVSDYISRLGAQIGMTTFAVAAKRDHHHKPIYYLIFGTRHPDGVWFFADSVAKSSEKWREVLATREEEERPTLTGIVESQAEINQKMEDEACEAIQNNILEILGRHGDFVVGQFPSKVFGSYFGEVRETVVRRAIKELKQKGLTSSTGIGSRIDELEVKRPS